MPADGQESEVLVTIDVEWSADEVVEDTVRLLDERGIAATFFCTHAGTVVPGHERALHPNFRRSRNPLADQVDALRMDDREFYRYVVAATREFCPEAVGTRSHSLLLDSDMMPVFRDAGLEYDSSVMLPFAPGLTPVPRGSGILEIPAYYMDHWDLYERATDLTLEDLRLESPGMKVMIFHPNLIFANAATIGAVDESRPHYHDVQWLLDNRCEGRGTRTLFIEMLDMLAGRATRTRTLAEVSADWRAAAGGMTV
jgi:hypothetical protein